MTGRGPQPPWLRELVRVADSHGWDNVSYRMLGAADDGYLFLRGHIEIDVRVAAGRISKAVRTRPGSTADQPSAGKVEAVKSWLSAPAHADATSGPRPERFTRVHRGVWGGVQLVTHDACAHCRGPITNRGITSGASSDTDRWLHSRAEDWEHDVHPAVPAGGPVTGDDQPRPWTVLGTPIANASTSTS